jgi:hypothetical protein
MNPTCLHGLEIGQELDLIVLHGPKINPTILHGPKINPTILHGPWASIKIEPKKIS